MNSMSNTGYDVFICCRPENGAEARQIRDALFERGFRVFQDRADVDPVDSGEVPSYRILHCIDEATCFVVILSPLGLDRLQDMHDRLGREIAHAVETKRKIIPIFLEGFTYPPYLPAGIETLKRYQGLKYSLLDFEAMIEAIAARIAREPETRTARQPDQTNAEAESTGIFGWPQPVLGPSAEPPKPRPSRETIQRKLGRVRPPEVQIGYETRDAERTEQEQDYAKSGLRTDSHPEPEIGAQQADASLLDILEQLKHRPADTVAAPPVGEPPPPGAPPRVGSPMPGPAEVPSPPGPPTPSAVSAPDRIPVKLPWLGPSAWIGRRLRIAERRVAAFLGRGMRGVKTDPVDCTVFGPPAVAVGNNFLVQVFVHRPEQAETAKNLSKEFDQTAERRGFRSLEAEIRRGSTLRFHLAMGGLSIDDEVQQITWRGEPESVQFGVAVPCDFAPGTVIGTVTVDQDSVPLGYIKFKLTVTPPAQAVAPSLLTAVGEVARLYKKAFISYASPDRNEVLKRVQMLAELRVSFFQDVLGLEPGERWQKALYRHIDESDLFLLFWSTAAKQSKWVLEEVNYALRRKGNDEFAPPEILPVIIEGPPPVPPPAELESLHFNDRLIYFMTPGYPS